MLVALASLPQIFLFLTMVKDNRITPEDSDEESLDSRVLLAGGVFLFIAGAASGAMLYAFGLAGRTFDLSVLRGGLLTFGVISLCVAAGVIAMTVLIQLLGVFWPRSLTFWSETRLLKRAKKKTLTLLQRRHDLQEERARLTAKMQATYVMEKESAKVANQQALQELRGALQTSMVRSCEIVFEHLNRTLDQYHELIAEIEASALSAVEKKELLNSLSSKLSTDSMEQKRQSTQQMMESAIWEIRFRKARLMAAKKSDAAVSYLQKIRQRTESHKILLQIDALIRELSPEGSVRSK
jgi:membrane protein implicated in regulation of membrane protease activity